MEVAAGRLPLSALLSQILVAFTIEFDNEFERQMPHRTTNDGLAAGARAGPWLVSLVMWSTCMRFVTDERLRVADLERLAGTKTNLNGMQRWGYIVVAPDTSNGPAKQPLSKWLIRATPEGRIARKIWEPLFDVMEERWRARFGKDEVAQLMTALRTTVSALEIGGPDCLPILGYGLFTKQPERKSRVRVSPEERNVSDLPLVALVSRVLRTIAIEFEQASKVSLCISANIVRILDEKGVRIRDLPLLSGVSKEGIKMALGVLQKQRFVVLGPEQAAGRIKVARLTTKGRAAQQAYPELLRSIEESWEARIGRDAVDDLRRILERFVGDALFRGLEPDPDRWRASLPRPRTLPHYPMILHRGGYPDGS